VARIRTRSIAPARTKRRRATALVSTCTELVRTPRLEALEERTLLSATALGNEYQLNTAVTNNQSAVAMGSHPKSTQIIAAWVSASQDGSGDGVYAQRYDLFGNRIGAEFRVNGATSGNQNAPAVAMDALGNFVVAFQSSSGDGSGDGIYARRYGYDATALANEFRVNALTSGNQQAPSIAMDDDGDFVVAFHSATLDGDGNGIAVRRYNISGVAQGNEFQVNQTTAGNQQAAVVAMSSTGQFTIAWQSAAQDGSGDTIVARQYTNAGVALGNEFVVNQTTAGNQSSPSISSNADGSFVIAWQSAEQDGNGDAIVARRYASNGSPQGNEFVVNEFTTGNQSAPSVSTTATNGFVVAWQSALQDGNGDAVIVRRYSATGTPLENEFIANAFVTGAQNSPAVAIQSDGDFQVAWQSPGQETGGAATLGVFARRYSVVNDAPSLKHLFNQITDVGGTVSFTAQASDQDAAIDVVTFSLEAGAPLGATIDASTGAFTWSTAGFEPGRYEVTVEVRDSAGLLDKQVLPITVFAPGERTALDDYVNDVGADYKWDIRSRVVGTGYTEYNVLLTSGTWRTSAEVNKPLWQHWVKVYVPNFLLGKAVLFIDGGNNTTTPPTSGYLTDYAGPLTQVTGAIFVDLFSIPSQPLTFTGESSSFVEDQILAYSWAKYLETGDPTWAAHLPMTRAAARAMDAVSDMLSSPVGGNKNIDSFLVTGGSKRGWTTWLTAAVDPRVSEIAPIVSDLLNTETNFVHHYSFYDGTFSSAVNDYVNEGVLDIDNFGKEPIDTLLSIVDPYTYRDRLTLPKYMMNASGDEFFTPDSWQFYYDNLLGPKAVRYVPNTTHGISNESVYLEFFNAITVLLFDQSLPEYTFQQLANGTIEVQTSGNVTSAKLWKATNATKRDFRWPVIGAAFTSTTLVDQGGGVYRGLPPAAAGWTAYFVELTIEDYSGQPVIVTSGVYIRGTAANEQPDLASISDLVITEGSPLAIQASATDPDTGQTLTYSLEPGAPAQVAIHPTTGNLTALWNDQVAAVMPVTVTVWDNGAPALPDRDTFRITVVNAAPTATLAGPVTGLPGQSLLFTLLASDPSSVDQAAGFTFRLDWDGNGTIDQTITGPSGTTVSHTFATADTFNARLTATDKDNGTSSTSTLVVSTNKSPVAPGSQAPFSVVEGQSLELATSGWTDPDGHALAYSWDVDNDGQFDDASGVSATVPWSTLVALGLIDGDAAHQVRVRVDDSHGGVTISAPIVLALLNAPPTASAGGPYTTLAGNGVTLAGLGSDPAGALDPLTFAWDLDGDLDFDDAIGNAPNLTWSQLVPLGLADGMSTPYTITLRVSDDDGGVTDVSTTLTIENVAPSAAVAGDVINRAGTAAAFTLTALDLESADQAANFSFQIDWDGNGTFDQTVVGPSGTIVNHIFAAGGSYHVQVRATDKDGGTSENATHTIHVWRLAQVGANLEWEGSDGDDAVQFIETAPNTVEVHTTKVASFATNVLETYSGITGRVIGKGNAGHDALHAGALTSLAATLEGGRHNDTLTGGAADDILRGEFVGAHGDGAEGNDSITGGAGHDLIEGDGLEGGKDTLRGGLGNDTILGDGSDGAEGRADSLFGDDGDDQIFGHHGHDFIDGGNDRDLITGGDGAEANDTLVGGAGHDVLSGGAGKDSLSGGIGNDVLLGGIGLDSLRGDAGEDLLLADATTFDLNAAALLAIHNEWASANSYEDRIAHLTGTPGGENGSTSFQLGTNVFDDGEVDNLTGGTELDWYIYNLLEDVLTDHAPGESETDTSGFPLPE